MYTIYNGVKTELMVTLCPSGPVRHLKVSVVWQWAQLLTILDFPFSEEAPSTHSNAEPYIFKEEGERERGISTFAQFHIKLCMLHSLENKKKIDHY